MSQSKLYLIDRKSAMYPIALGYVMSRDKAFESNRAFLKNIAEYNRVMIGNDGYIAYVEFAKTPEGWQRDVRGMCYPVHKSGTRALIREQTSPVPNQTYLIKTQTAVPTQIEYYEKGFTGVQSENIGKLNNPCGFQWISNDGPFAFWIPDVAYYIKSAEKRGCSVLERYKKWEMRVRDIKEISHVEWSGIMLSHRLEVLDGNNVVARKS